MIRYALLALYVSGILVYSWKDWLRALCPLIVLVGLLERPDMPAEMLGIQGLNPFNIGLAGIVVAWAVSRNRQGLTWDAPRWLNVLTLLVAVVMFVGFLRLFINPSNLMASGPSLSPRSTRFGLVLQFGLNTFKWVIPGILVFQGCRSKEQHQWVVLSLVGLYLVLALQTINQMPLSYLLDGEALQQRAVRVLDKQLGYHRVELAGVFAGASWAMLAVRPLFSSRLMRCVLFGTSAITVLALALTGGRMGYGAWCLVGFLMAGLRWRRALLLGPIAIALLIGFAPGIPQRLLQGISYDKRSGEALDGPTDISTVTAERSKLWPYILESIAERPVPGYGRDALNRNGLKEKVFREIGESFGHPHNGYFQFALDNGLVGLTIYLIFAVALLTKSAALFRRDDPQAAAAGGLAFALLASYLIAAAGAQTFYPTELSIGLWCAIALMMRVSLRQSRAQGTPEAVPHPEAAHIMKAHRLRWAVARVDAASTVQPAGPASAKVQELKRPRHEARVSVSTGRSRTLGRWRARQTR